MSDASSTVKLRKVVWTSVGIVAPFGLAAALLHFRFRAPLTTLLLILGAAIVVILFWRIKGTDIPTGLMLDIFAGGLALGGFLAYAGLFVVVRRSSMVPYLGAIGLVLLWCAYDLVQALRKRELGIFDDDS
jgi:hypothetical protein